MKVALNTIMITPNSKPNSVRYLFSMLSTFSIFFFFFRYPFYMLSVFDVKVSFITWMRYTAWIPLYPLGILLEGNFFYIKNIFPNMNLIVSCRNVRIYYPISLYWNVDFQCLLSKSRKKWFLFVFEWWSTLGLYIGASMIKTV